MTPLNTTPEARLCPRCQQDNQCAVALGTSLAECWCHTANFIPERVEAWRGLNRCLCQRCGTELEAVDTVQHHSPARPNQHLNKESHGQ